MGTPMTTQSGPYEHTEFGVTIHCALCGNTCDSFEGMDSEAEALAEAMGHCGWRLMDGSPVCSDNEEHLRGALRYVVAVAATVDWWVGLPEAIGAARRLLAFEDAGGRR